MNRFRPLLTLATVSLMAGCQYPAVGLYQTRAVEGVTYVERAGKPLKMDIVTPVDAGGPRPAVVMVHGGGWALGTRKDMRAAAEFLGTMGFVGVTIDYRLVPEGAIYPQPVRDCLAAVKYLRKNAAQYGIDPARIAIGGDSAGGQLALMVGLPRDVGMFGDDSYPGVSTAVSAIIDIYGPSNMVTLYDHGLYIVRPEVRKFMGGTPEERPKIWKEASAITYARADAPPVLILHGDGDAVVPFSHAEELERAIRSAGGRCTLVRVGGASHGWCGQFMCAPSIRTLPAMVRFLSEVFDEPTIPGK